MRRTEYLIGRRDPKTLRVVDVMEDAVITCSPHASVQSVALRLCDGGFGSIPVVDENRTLLGLVSEFDLLNVMRGERDLAEITVDEVMTRDVESVTEDMPVSALIERMQARHLIRLPVLRDNMLVGIVARRDILFGYMMAVS